VQQATQQTRRRLRSVKWDSEFREYRGRAASTVPGLQRIRYERGFSQRQLAALVGVSHFIIPRIEGGGRTSMETLGKLAAVLRVESLEELLHEGAGDECHAEQEGELVAT